MGNDEPKSETARQGAKGCKIMTMQDLEHNRSSGTGWLYTPLILILFVGGALSIGAYFYEPGLSIPESLAAGFGGLAALIVGLVASVIGVVIGLLGAVFGLAVGGGAAVLTLFIVASPVIAIILLFMLTRRKGNGCPDPTAHE